MVHVPTSERNDCNEARIDVEFERLGNARKDNLFTGALTEYDRGSEVKLRV
jgi:hypothetical protein